MIASRRQLLGGVILSLGLSLTKFFPFGSDEFGSDEKRETDGRWFLYPQSGIYMWTDGCWWVTTEVSKEEPDGGVYYYYGWKPVSDTETLASLPIGFSEAPKIYNYDN